MVHTSTGVRQSVSTAPGPEATRRLLVADARPEHADARGLSRDGEPSSRSSATRSAEGRRIRAMSLPWPGARRSITSLSNTRKSMLAGVDIGRWRGYGFSRSRDQQGLAETNCRQQYTQLQCAGRCGGGVPKPRLLQDGDGTDGRTGWPAVIRGRREQDRSKRSGSTRKCSSQYPAVKSVSSTSVKASAADARTGKFGSGVLSQSRRRTGDRAGCRRVALSQATEQYAVPVGKC